MVEEICRYIVLADWHLSVDTRDLNQLELRIWSRDPYTVRKNPSYYRNNWYPKCTSDAEPSVTGLGTMV